MMIIKKNMVSKIHNACFKSKCTLFLRMTSLIVSLCMFNTSIISSGNFPHSEVELCMSVNIRAILPLGGTSFVLLFFFVFIIEPELKDAEADSFLLMLIWFVISLKLGLSLGF